MKKTLAAAIIFCVMCLFLAVTALAVIENDNPERLYDGADLLTSSEEASLLKKLDGISEEFGVDVIVVTVEDTGSYSVDDFTENYYDTVFGQHNDGVMLLLSMEERDYRILSEGIGNDAVPYDDIESIGEDIVPYLSDGDYAEAFNLFADKCEYEINGEINGQNEEFTGNSSSNTNSSLNKISSTTEIVKIMFFALFYLIWLL